VLLASVLRMLIRRGLRSYDTSLAQMTGGLVYIALLALGVLLALWILIPSVRFNTIFTSLGVTGIVLGFALKDILENFVAGIIILWRRPFRAGDQIGSAEYEGTVEEINFRATVMRTFDGIRVYIPNSLVLTQPVENFTAFENRRSEIVLGIEQSASIEEARRIILRELSSTEGVLQEPEPLVLFHSIGDFTNNLAVLYWIRPPTRMSDRITQSDVTERLFSALQANGIDFPYPIRTVELRRDV
jgi:small-conductance mechanosensitive channel